MSPGIDGFESRNQKTKPPQAAEAVQDESLDTSLLTTCDWRPKTLAGNAEQEVKGKTVSEIKEIPLPPEAPPEMCPEKKPGVVAASDTKAADSDLVLVKKVQKHLKISEELKGALYGFGTQLSLVSENPIDIALGAASWAAFAHWAVPLLKTHTPETWGVSCIVSVVWLGIKLVTMSERKDQTLDTKHASGLEKVFLDWRNNSIKIHKDASSSDRDGGYFKGAVIGQITGILSPFSSARIVKDILSVGCYAALSLSGGLWNYLKKHISYE